MESGGEKTGDEFSGTAGPVDPSWMISEERGNEQA